MGPLSIQDAPGAVDALAARPDAMVRLLSGEVLYLPQMSEAETDFLARAQAAAKDPTVSVDQMIELLYGPENPILDTTFLPGRAMVTRAVFERPLYHVLGDLLGFKRIQHGKLDMAAAAARYNISVEDAARQLGTSPESVLALIRARRLAVHFRDGQWWVSPETIASYTVAARFEQQSEGPPIPTRNG
jgi:hypothetical protein